MLAPDVSPGVLAEQDEATEGHNCARPTLTYYNLLPPILSNLTVHCYCHILMRLHVSELDHLMLLARQFSPSTWFLPVLLDGLELPAV
jgi:hypothetical protein